MKPAKGPQTTTGAPDGVGNVWINQDKAYHFVLLHHETRQLRLNNVDQSGREHFAFLWGDGDKLPVIDEGSVVRGYHFGGDFSEFFLAV